jgi:D-alanyl-D-alanine carboxypeptidase
MMRFLGRLGSAAAVAALTVGFVAPTAVAGGTTTTYDIDSASSLTVVVNKHRPLDPPSYVPKPLTRIKTEQLRSDAALAYQEMVKKAKADRVNIVTISGYRSYDHQASLYASYVQQYGQETADTIAARPGHSEHQTGLAMDVGNASGACALQDCFEGTPVGVWVAEHADEYGFIIRYPDGDENQKITGYDYEPWHLRYVGPDLIEDMQNAANEDPRIDTLEEFFKLAPAPDYLS